MGRLLCAAWGLLLHLGAPPAAVQAGSTAECVPLSAIHHGAWGGSPWVVQSGPRVMLWRPRRVFAGQLLPVEIVVEPTCGVPRIRWDGREFATHVVAGRRQALLPVRLDIALGERVLTVVCRETELPFRLSVDDATYPEAHLSVDPKYAREPPPRVVAEQEQFDRAFANGVADRLWSGEPFVIPASGQRTSRFGVRRTFNATLVSRHRGIDIDGKTGDPIQATHDGIVALVAKEFYYTGNAVLLDHGDGLFTTYLHMSSIDVTQGDRVRRGQRIGTIGATGRVTGPHLHFGVKLKGTYVCPDDLFAHRPGARLAPAEVGVESVRRPASIHPPP